MADIGEATSCNRSKCGRIILISREWFPTCLIYYCPRDQHRCHPRLGLLDSKFIALWYWLPHFFFSHLSEPRKKKKKISPVLFSLFDTFVSINFYYRKKRKFESIIDINLLEFRQFRKSPCRRNCRSLNCCWRQFHRTRIIKAAWASINQVYCLISSQVIINIWDSHTKKRNKDDHWSGSKQQGQPKGRIS